MELLSRETGLRPKGVILFQMLHKHMYLHCRQNSQRSFVAHISQVPQLYCIQLGVQYPKNSKIWLWLLPQPTLGNALVEVDKNWNISGLLSGFQLEKLFFIHTVRSYSHSTATAEFVKATAGFVMSSEASDQLYFSHFSTFRFLLGNIWLFLG